MERFVFIAAVTIAILFGVGWAFGDRFFHFSIDGDSEGGPRTAPIVELAPGSMASQTFAGERIRIRNSVARVVVTPEDRADFAIEIDNSAGRTPMPQVTVDGGRVVIDGGLRGRISRCTEGGGADLRGYESVTGDQVPVITIRAPRNLNISVGGGATTQISATESLNADFNGCGDATIGDVAGDFDLDLAGSSTVRAGAANALNVDLAGSGDVQTGAIAAGADIDVAGSGSVTIASLTGALNSDGAGSGSVVVQGGAVTTASIDLAGSGDIEIAAPVESLDVSIVGSGDVAVRGVVGSIDAEIAGSGNVSAQSVTGEIRKQVWGSGSVDVGG